jgi:hypothetical protein
MRFSNWVACAAAMTVITFGAASTAQGQVVTFSNINDGVASKFFDAARTAPTPFNANKLTIGFHSGLDRTILKNTNFRASTAAFSYSAAMDTISFTVTAPTGFYVAKIIYTQRGTGSVLRTGKASGGSTWVVGGFARSLGTFTTNPFLSKTMDLTGKNMTVVPVTITTSLFAFATPSLGSASVGLTSADVVVHLLPLP